MNVLLCSPFGAGTQHVQGGIAVWAQNIIDYYRKIEKDVHIHVAPFDRKDRNKSMDERNMLERAWYGFIDYRVAIKSVSELLFVNKIDVLHLCSSASIGLVRDFIVIKKAKQKGAKAVIHFHFGRIPDLAKKKNWEWKLLLRVSRLADAVITMDLKSYNSLKKQGINSVYYLPNPLSQSVLQLITSAPPSFLRKERRICFVGHVIPTKGVFELVKACKGINDIRLHVVGKVTTDVRNQMEMIAENGSWLIFEGEVDHREVISEMLSSSIFVLPSYTEGFPNVILESMACGCAIVTTPVGAIPEMLNLDSKEPCGLCSSTKDVEGLRKNIQFFVDNPDKANVFGERATIRVHQMYAMPTIWKQLVGIWYGVVNENNKVSVC